MPSQLQLTVPLRFHTLYTRLVVLERYCVWARMTMANGESTALNSTSSPGLTMERWEMWLALAASVGSLAAVVWHSLLNVTYAATMIEYVSSSCRP